MPFFFFNGALHVRALSRYLKIHSFDHRSTTVGCFSITHAIQTCTKVYVFGFLKNTTCAAHEWSVVLVIVFSHIVNKNCG